jgi:hypothetical protein
MICEVGRRLAEGMNFQIFKFSIFKLKPDDLSGRRGKKGDLNGA